MILDFTTEHWRQRTPDLFSLQLSTEAPLEKSSIQIFEICDNMMTNWVQPHSIQVIAHETFSNIVIMFDRAFVGYAVVNEG